MLITLALRHLLVRKLRSLFLLLGFSLGVGVMIVLLSVGRALLEQSRDPALVGGGAVTILPLGIDVEAMRTGGIGSMFFGIDRSRFLVRQALGGARHRDLVSVVSPAIEGKLVYLGHAGQLVPVRAGGDIPSRARAVGSGLELISGEWTDSPADSAYAAPNLQQLYDELDRFHVPPSLDSAWGEWHYFNLRTSPAEWWYITYLVGGSVPPNQAPSNLASRAQRAPAAGWGGQFLVTHRRPDGKYLRFIAEAPAGQIDLDTAGADLQIGTSSVRQRHGRYTLHGSASGAAGRVVLDVALSPAGNRFFPPVELRDDDFVSGYVVPALAGTASGRVCVASQCRSFANVPAYHDHNWGIWRDVTWEWGAAQGKRLSLLYGGVYGPTRDSVAGNTDLRSPFFLTVVDSLGVLQVLRFNRIQYSGVRPTAGTLKARAPARFHLVAIRDSDSLQLRVRVADALATEIRRSGFRRIFLQMQGDFVLGGRVAGSVVADSGRGFFETYVVPR